MCLAQECVFVCACYSKRVLDSVFLCMRSAHMFLVCILCARVLLCVCWFCWAQMIACVCQCVCVCVFEIMCVWWVCVCVCLCALLFACVCE